MTRPGDSVEGITVPLGDPDALLAAGRQLEGVAAQLEGSSGQIAGMPSLMSSWAGPGSSAFASVTGHEAASVRSSSGAVLMAAFSVQTNAGMLEDAQRKAQKAIVRAKRAREEINQAREDIRDAVDAQVDARGRMEFAAAAREAAEIQALASVVDALAGSGAASAAAAAADAEYRAAERDLHEAERREARARDRLQEAEEDMRAARRDGREAADDAESMGVGLTAALAGLPSGVLAMPGAPAVSHIDDAAGIPRVQPQDIPISEREPPENWPGWAQSLYKLGRGEATAIAGVVDLAESAYHNPEKIPDAVGELGERTYHDPLGTGKALIGYDELAAGRYEDWFGAMGVAALSGGAGTLPSRASRLNRVVGSPRVQPLGRSPYPINSQKLAGSRLDFTKLDFGVRPGSTPPRISAANRAELAAKYPDGVRFTRAGYPVFTQHAIERVHVDGMTGDRVHDADLANHAAKRRETPADYVWHHVEDGRTMELVPRDLHDAARHTGGAAAIGNQQVGQIAPGGVFTPWERRFGAGGAAAGFGIAGPAAAGSQ
jgi:hypothetical protein